MLEIFLAQYSTVFLLGWQSLNVRDGKKLAAAFVSLLLSISGWYVTGIISQAYSQGVGSGVFYAFCLAGPLGIVSSMICYGRKE